MTSDTAVSEGDRTVGQVCGFFQLSCGRLDLELGGVFAPFLPLPQLSWVSGDGAAATLRR